jgi:hypothetical protein
MAHTAPSIAKEFGRQRWKINIVFYVVVGAMQTFDGR